MGFHAGFHGAGPRENFRSGLIPKLLSHRLRDIANELCALTPFEEASRTIQHVDRNGDERYFEIFNGVAELLARDGMRSARRGNIFERFPQKGYRVRNGAAATRL